LLAFSSFVSETEFVDAQYQNIFDSRDKCVLYSDAWLKLEVLNALALCDFEESGSSFKGFANAWDIKYKQDAEKLIQAFVDVFDSIIAFRFQSHISKKITNEQVDKQVVNSRNYLNPLEIRFPFSFASELVDMNWHDISFSINHGFLSHESAVDHARYILGENEEHPQAVLDIACLYPNEAVFPHSIHPYIDELANAVSEQEKDMTKSKVLYLVLKWVYDNRMDYENPLTVVDIMYCSLDRPRSISHFVSDMPGTRECCEHPEPDRERLMASWVKFLDEQRVVFSK